MFTCVYRYSKILWVFFAAVLLHAMPLTAQDCEVVAHVVEKIDDEEKHSLAILSAGLSSKYTTLSEVEGNKGFFYADKYYISIDDSNATEVLYHFYNTGNWTLIETQKRAGDGRKILSVVYNPADGMVYCVAQEREARTYVWYKEQLSDGGLNIVEGSEMVLSRAYYAMCATHDGVIYGFAADAGLYRIASQDGSGEKVIGTTSVGMDSQSSWIDETAGVVYRAVSSSIGTSLYSYNLTAKSEKFVKVYSLFKSVISMAVNDFPVEYSCPMAVADLAIQWGNNHNRGFITFTAPVKDIDGNELVDTLTLLVQVDSIMIDSLCVLPGAECRVPYEFVDGEHEVQVIVRSKYGDSQAAVCEIYAGYDEPMPVNRVNISSDFPYVDIWWAVPEGKHGQEIDTLNLRYRVVRYPDKVIVADTTATSLRDTLPQMPFLYQYGVVAYLPEYVTPEVKSSLFYYECTMEPPLSFTYWDENIFNAFKVDDANEDGVSWDYFNTASGELAVRYKYSSINNADDYLYFPKMHLQEGLYYEATVYMHVGSEKYSEKFSMGISTADIELGRKELLPQQTIQEKNSTPYTKGFMVEEDGDYRLYIHCSSDANHHLLYIDSLFITVSDMVSQPRSVDKMELAADKNNPGVVTIHCVAPIYNVAGELLEALEKVEFYRDDNLIYVRENPIPGEEIVYRDSVSGIDEYTYRIVAVNSSGRSEIVEKSMIRGVANYPFAYDFVNGVGFFTIIDNNRDGATWHFYEDRFMGCMRYMSSESNDADDWLVTPPIYLSDSIRYQIEYSCCAGHSYYPESMRVLMGRTPQPNSMSVLIDDVEDFTCITDTCIVAPFDIWASGIYYIAFQVVSPADSYAMLMRNVKIDEYDPMSVTKTCVTEGIAWGGDGCIMVDVETDSHVIIYSLDGRIVDKFVAQSDTIRCNVVQGIYIVDVEGVRVKVVVR